MRGGRATSTGSHYRGRVLRRLRALRRPTSARRLCPEHDAPLEDVEEENWFFRLSRYARAAARADRVGPAAHRARRRGATRCSSFVARRAAGLQHLAFGRRARAAGASPFPDDPDAGHLRLVRRARQLHHARSDGGRCSTGTGADADARARDRQGHPALPRRLLAGDPAVGRAAAVPDTIFVARLPHRGRTQDRQVARQRRRSVRAGRRVRGRRRPLLAPAPHPRRPRTATSRASGWSGLATPISPISSATSCRGWCRWCSATLDGVVPARPRAARPRSRAHGRCRARALRAPRRARGDLAGRRGREPLRRRDEAVGARAGRRPSARRPCSVTCAQRSASWGPSSSRSCRDVRGDPARVPGPGVRWSAVRRYSRRTVSRRASTRRRTRRRPSRSRVARTRAVPSGMSRARRGRPRRRVRRRVPRG